MLDRLLSRRRNYHVDDPLALRGEAGQCLVGY
jgi:hypothetical protein